LAYSIFEIELEKLKEMTKNKNKKDNNKIKLVTIIYQFRI
jgi:hypothetical protein